MTVVTQACPFCNGPVPESGASGRRLTCPRCGETFAPRESNAVQDAEGIVRHHPGVESPAPTPEVDRYLGQQPDVGRRNQRLGMLVFAIMTVMAGAGLTLALMTQAQRRGHDTNLPRALKNSQAGEDVTAIPPGPVQALQSPLIGYVPDGTNVLLGIHLAELRNDRGGLELLRKEIPIGGQMSLPLDITPWTGLNSEDVDYALLTATLTRNLFLGDFNLALLVHTRRPVDQADVIRRLQAVRDVPSGTNTATWKFRPRGQKLDWSMRFVNEHTLALGIIPGNLMAVPASPRVGLGHLSKDLQTWLPHIETGGVVWLATNFDQPTRDLLLGRAGGEGKESRAALKGVQTLVAWVRPGNPVTLSAQFCCADHAAAEALSGYLAALAPDMHTPDLELKVEDSCLSVRRRADLATILETIGKGIKRP